MFLFTCAAVMQKVSSHFMLHAWMILFCLLVSCVANNKGSAHSKRLISKSQFTANTYIAAVYIIDVPSFCAGDSARVDQT